MMLYAEYLVALEKYNIKGNIGNNILNEDLLKRLECTWAGINKRIMEKGHNEETFNKLIMECYDEQKLAEIISNMPTEDYATKITPLLIDNFVSCYDLAFKKINVTLDEFEDFCLTLAIKSIVMGESKELSTRFLKFMRDNTGDFS